MNAKLNLAVKILILGGMALGLALMVYLTYQVVIYPCFPAIDGPDEPIWKFLVSYAFVVICFVLAEYIAWTLFQMMRSLDGDPFVESNVKALRNMGVAALVIMALGLLTLALRAVPLAVIFALPIGMCGLFSLVLSGVFARAVVFKKENDLTV